MTPNNSLTLKDFLRERNLAPVRLHLGCGGMKWKDFVNVDLYPAASDEQDSSRNGCVADCYADMRDLKIGSETVDEIFTSHTIDHFPRWEAMRMFQHWLCVLKPNGKLVIEVADFWRCVYWLFHPLRRKRELARSQFYGNQWDEIDYETHRYVWSASELKAALLKTGFAKVRVSHRTHTHHPGRDMRVEAVK